MEESGEECGRGRNDVEHIMERCNKENNMYMDKKFAADEIGNEVEEMRRTRMKRL